MDLPDSEFRIGQRVMVILNDRNRTAHEGTIRQVTWHYKEGRYIYYLEERGRQVSKRYLAADLRAVPGGDPG